MMFLIHYGWRGTLQRIALVSGLDLFLIHYGWRGTYFLYVYPVIEVSF